MSAIPVGSENLAVRRVYHTGRMRLIITFLVGVFACWLCLWLDQVDSVDRVKQLIVVYLGGPIFAGVALGTATKLLCRTPAMVIDEDGIELPNLLVGTFRLSWREIQRFGVFVVKGRRMLGVDLVNTNQTLNRLGWQKRLSAMMNSSFWNYPFSIAANTLPVALEQVIQELAMAHRAAGLSKPLTYRAGISA